MNKVYIFGAGASAGYENSELGLRSPTANDFLQKAGWLIHHEYITGELFRNLFSFLQNYYNLNESQWCTSNINIEEVLTIMDLNLKKYRDARSELIKLIYLTLYKILYGNPCPHHQSLINQLEPSDVIITFNWDLLVDNRLSSLGNRIPNYMHPFARYFVDNVWHDDIACNGGPQLLKLHGSLNWMYCEECKLSYSYIRSGKVVAGQILNPENRLLQCPECREFTLTPVIIPPTLNKSYRKWKVISAAWKHASKALEKAEEITIIGYSLPVTDFRATWLFLDSMAKRTSPLMKLTVVDKYPNGLFERYRKIFRVPERNFVGIQGEIKCLSNIAND